MTGQVAPELHWLEPVIATPESLEGYGWLIGRPRGPERDRINFYGSEVRVLQPAQFRSNADTCLNLVSFRRRELTVRWMEYHSKHTQTFIPLEGKSFYMVLGKPTQRRPDGGWSEIASALPDPADVRAFYFDGSGGIVMQVGTWHEVPFPLDAETNFVCICTNETNDDLERQGADGECRGGDLDKKNIAKNLGFTFAIAQAPA